MNRILQLALLFFLLLPISQQVLGEDDFNQQSTLVIADRALLIDNKSHEIVKKQFIDLKSAKEQQLQSLQESGINQNILKHAQLDFIAAKTAVEGANIALTDVNESVDDTEKSIRTLEKNLQSLILLTKDYHDRKDKIILLEARLEFLKQLQQIQLERVQTLSQIKLITQQRLNFENSWQQKLQTLYLLQQQEQQRNHLSEVLSILQKEQQDWLLKLNELTQQLSALTSKGPANDSSLKKLHLTILEAEENVALIKLKSYLVHIQNRVENLQEINKSQKTSTQLNNLCSQVANILVQLSSTGEFMNSKIKFLALKKNEFSLDLNKNILSYPEMYSYSRILTNLMTDYGNQFENINRLEQKATYYQRQFKLQLQHRLSERQKFPQDLTGWISLGQKMLQIPYLLRNAFSNLIHQSLLELQTLTNASLLMIFGCLPFLLVGWFYFRRFLLNLEINIKDNKQRFFTNIIFIFLELLRRNIGSLLAFLIFVNLILVLNSVRSLFICLFLLYLGFKLFLTIAKLILLENTNDISGADVKLYYRMRGSLILGLLLSILTVVAHQLPVAYEAKIFVNRLFMIFIFIIAIQFFKARKVVPNLLAVLIHIPRRYFYRVVQLLTVLIPLALLFNAIVGLLGFVELAWAIARYQLVFFAVMAGYLIIRGLLIDAMEYVSEVLIQYVKQGWLWTEAILKPMDRVLRVVLFILCSIFLAHLFHLDNNEQFIDLLNQLLQQKLFSIGGNAINALLLCELLVILSLIKWLAHWSREFSYRWLYVGAKDVGVRNSLSIFTQYLSVIVSVLIGLKILGIDLRGFTVVAAAFAAGIGFGMRDLIINFFSGILLLIERPFRNGDIITLGCYEGEVTQTGMRSMTIRTWDHMEVIVPNADMFTKPFVNWTHHDNIVRTVITLRLHREDDPHKVQRLLLELLHELKSVSNEPFPEVIINELSEALIEMQVRYYVLLTSQRTRAGVRSEVLFAIWDCFKENNIRAPHPQYDLILRTQRKEELIENVVVEDRNEFLESAKECS